MVFWWILRIPVLLAILVRKQVTLLAQQEKGYSPFSGYEEGNPSTYPRGCIAWAVGRLPVLGWMPASPGTLCLGLNWQQPRLEGDT